jgi:hypothetical protein
MGDNGELKAKTPEQLKQERLERYKENPDNFVELKDIVMCAIRNPASGIGISVYTGNCRRSEFDIALAELNHIAQKRLIQMDIEMEMKKQAASKLITPKGGIMNFVRRRK